MQDLPAYDYQPYTNNFVDYLPKVRLQLRGVQYPGRPKNSVFSSWEETVKDLQDRQDFGRYYRNKINYGRLWRDAEATVMAADDIRARIEAAYRFIIGTTNGTAATASSPPLAPIAPTPTAAAIARP